MLLHSNENYKINKSLFKIRLVCKSAVLYVNAESMTKQNVANTSQLKHYVERKLK